jgi:F-type H+-transporting ATPase subunit beta
MDNELIKGRITAVRGTVCDITFDDLNNGELPEIYHLLEVNDPDYTGSNSSNGQTTLPPLKMEVLSHLGDNTVRALALGNTFMLGRAMEVTYKKHQLRFPVNVTGRMFNTMGDTIDGFGEEYQILDDKYAVKKVTHYGSSPSTSSNTSEQHIIRHEIIQDPPEFKDISQSTELLHTYIKVVDVICPIAKGSKVGFFGGAGTGKTVFIKEMINTLTEKEQCKTIFAGVGERTREGAELWEEFTALHNQKIEDAVKKDSSASPEENGIMHNLSFIFGQMNEPPGIRFRTAHSAVRVAEYFRDQENSGGKNNVMLFIDNIFRFVQAGSEVSTLLGRIPSSVGYQPTLEMEIGDLQERICSTKNGSITSIQAVYVPADDMTDPAPTAIFANLESKIVLNRDIAAKALYPAVDILDSGSNLISKINESFADSVIQHYASENDGMYSNEVMKLLLLRQEIIVKKVKELLSKDKELEKIINLLGIDQLTPEQKITHSRAIALKYFFTQPFEVSKKFSGQEGQRVPIWGSLFGSLALCVHDAIGNFDDKQLLFLKDIGGLYESYSNEKYVQKKEALENKEFKAFIESLKEPMTNVQKVTEWIGMIRG